MCRSSSVRMTAFEFTPRSSDTSGAVIGCRYATMASVSSAAIDSRFCPFRSKYFFSVGSCSAREAKRQPPPACSSMKPPTLASRMRLISSICAMTASSPPSSANASASSSVRTGSLLMKRIASMAARSSLGSINGLRWRAHAVRPYRLPPGCVGRGAQRATLKKHLPVVEQRELRRIDLLLRFSDEDLAEELSLLQGDAAEAHQLERAEEDGDQLVAAAVLQEPLQPDRRLLLHLLVQLVHLVRDLVHRPLQLQRLRMVRLV